MLTTREQVNALKDAGATDSAWLYDALKAGGYYIAKIEPDHIPYAEKKVVRMERTRNLINRYGRWAVDGTAITHYALFNEVPK
jgi:hypothetical protein